jgi:hypothetical protein
LLASRIQLARDEHRNPSQRPDLLKAMLLADRAESNRLRQIVLNQLCHE